MTTHLPDGALRTIAPLGLFDVAPEPRPAAAAPCTVQDDLALGLLVALRV